MVIGVNPTAANNFAMTNVMGVGENNNVMSTCSATYAVSKQTMTPATVYAYTVHCYGGNNYYLTTVKNATTYYLAQTAAKNQIALVTEFDAETCAFEIVISNMGEASIKAPTQVAHNENLADEYLAFNLNNDTGDNTKARFAFYPGISDVIKKVSLYAVSAVESDTQKAQTFIYREMHLRDVNPSNGDDTNACRADGEGAKSYYDTAEAVWNSNDFAAARAIILAGDGDYANAVARLVAWATANNKSMNESTKILETNKGGISSELVSKQSSTIIIVTIISFVGLTAVGGYFFVRRRKQK